MKKTFFSLFVLVSALSLVLAGCGGESSPYSDPVKIEEIITVAEVEKLVGAKVDTPPMTRNNVDEQTGFWMSMSN